MRGTEDEYRCVLGLGELVQAACQAVVDDGNDVCPAGFGNRGHDRPPCLVELTSNLALRGPIVLAVPDHVAQHAGDDEGVLLAGRRARGRARVRQRPLRSRCTRRLSGGGAREPSVHGYGTTTTGRSASRMTACATLPSNADSSRPRPRLPMTISSARSRCRPRRWRRPHLREPRRSSSGCRAARRRPRAGSPRAATRPRSRSFAAVGVHDARGAHACPLAARRSGWRCVRPAIRRSRRRSRGRAASRGPMVPCPATLRAGAARRASAQTRNVLRSPPRLGHARCRAGRVARTVVPSPGRRS